MAECWCSLLTYTCEFTPHRARLDGEPADAGLGGGPPPFMFSVCKPGLPPKFQLLSGCLGTLAQED